MKSKCDRCCNQPSRHQLSNVSMTAMVTLIKVKCRLKYLKMIWNFQNI